jgi:hypothetical protein
MQANLVIYNNVIKNATISFENVQLLKQQLKVIASHNPFAKIYCYFDFNNLCVKVDCMTQNLEFRDKTTQKVYSL